MQKEIKRSMIIALTLYLLLIAAITLFQRTFIYIPGDNPRPDHTQAPWMQKITVTTQDALELQAWYSPAQDTNKPTIIHFHGNAGNIEDRIPKTIQYTDEKYGLLLTEYRGFGGNPGKPTEHDLYQDARTYMNWLIKKQNISPNTIIIHGESLGSGVATQMATEYKVKALILETPFTSATDVAKPRFFFIPPIIIRHLIWDRYNNSEKIKSINAPLLIGLAQNDQVVPSKLGQRLFDQANTPKHLEIYPDAVHNNLHQHGFAQETIRFLDQL